MAEVSREKLYREIGVRIRRARESQQPKLSQTQLAEKLGIERTSITNIESGAQRATLHLIYSMAQKLNLSLSELLPALDAPSIQDEPAGSVSLRLGDKTEHVSPEIKSFIDKAYE